MPLRSSAIELVSKAVAFPRLDRLLLAIQNRTIHPYIRALNYHDVPPSYANQFEEQVSSLCREFVPVGLTELDAFFEGSWPHERPGVLMTFDDGFRSHHDVVAPILERHGVPGWFMVPVAFVDTPAADQVAFAERQQLIYENPPTESGRVAITWDQARALAEKHVVGCHTWNHTRLAKNLSPEQLEEEIPQAKERLEAELGQEVRVFTWVGGEEWSYSAGAAATIRDAGFSYSFMGNSLPIRPTSQPLQLHRTNIEARFTNARLRTSLSGVMDLRYTAKRRRVDTLTG